MAKQFYTYTKLLDITSRAVEYYGYFFTVRFVWFQYKTPIKSFFFFLCFSNKQYNTNVYLLFVLLLRRIRLF